MDRFPNWPPSLSTLLYLPALFIGFTVHELAHAVVAYLLGDTSQVERKRLSFNPLRHVSWVGTVVFLLFGFGWAKPVWVDQTRFRIKNRAFGMFLVSIAGACANLLTALLAFVGIMATGITVSALTGTSMWDVFMFLTQGELKLDWQGWAVALSSYIMTVNLVLAFFNLFPFPPLDGFQAMLSLLTMVRGGLRRREGAEQAPRLATMVSSGEESASSPAQIHFNIGLEYQKEGQLDEAIARYRQAIVHDKVFDLAYYNQGLAYLSKGRRGQAISSFQAARQSSRDVGVRYEADLRLRELARAEQEPSVELGPVPPPLELGAVLEPGVGIEPPLDATVSRRVWLRLIAGGVAMLVLAIAIWLFVTGVALSAMM